VLGGKELAAACVFIHAMAGDQSLQLYSYGVRGDVDGFPAMLVRRGSEVLTEVEQGGEVAGKL